MPCRGATVPNTGVRRACSIDFSRYPSCGCWAGNSQWAPVGGRSKSSRGTDGRAAGSRSAPHPGMVARNSSAVRTRAGWVSAYGRSGIGILLLRVFSAGRLLCGAGHDDGLDAVVELGREHVVPLGDLVERDPVGDDVARV